MTPPPAQRPATAFAVAESGVPAEHWDDARGRIGFRTLLSAGTTPTDSLTCGVAMLAPGGHLAPHRHEPAELYHGLEGEARVTIDGQDHRLAPGVTIWIPGNAVHGIRAETGPVRFFYAFARDSFDEVVYDFAV